MSLFELYLNSRNTYKQQILADLAFHFVKCGNEHYQQNRYSERRSKYLFQISMKINSLKKLCSHVPAGMFPLKCSHVPTYLFRYFVPKRRGNMFPKSRKMFPLRWRPDAMFPLFPLFPRKNRTLQERKKTIQREREREKKNALRAIYKKKVRTLGTHFVFSL